MYVSIDDTDSVNGMCTTYICSVILDELKYFGYKVDGYPHLIRLNPFARFKTRGNGALSFNVPVEDEKRAQIVKDIVLKKVDQLSWMEDDRTNPGVVFYNGPITEKFNNYSLNAIRNIVSMEKAEKFAHEIGADYYKFKKGRGLIGALAAIGCPDYDKTYEILAYRIPENYGKKRLIDYNSVYLMNDETYPLTFDNIDDKNGYIAIEPHTPCPILYGIRGENPESVLKAHKLVKVCEPVERFTVFQTNQHTDMHLVKIESISKMKKFGCYIVEGIVKNYPTTFEGGHVIFTLYDETAEVQCAAYEPTKEFREVIRKLVPQDQIRVFGGIGNKGTLNIEKIEILKLAKIKESKNPLCECGKRMKSAGSNKGFKCTQCGARLRNGVKELLEMC